MCASDTREELTLNTAGSTCSCCSPETSAVVSEATPETAASRRFDLEGLTCGHCVQSVEQAVTALEGVDGATVELVAGGTSALMVSGTVDEALIRVAVEMAGYSVSLE